MNTPYLDSKRGVKTAQQIGFGLMILAGLFVVSRYNFLLFHGLAELFGIAVAWSVFFLVWNSRRIARNDALLFIGIAYLFIGMTDFIHTLSYKGMGVFPDHLGANYPTQLWIAARGLEAISLLLFPLFITRRVRPLLVLGTYAAITSLMMAAIFLWHVFPDCYFEGQGLTTFKKGAEYLICLILAVAIALLFGKRDHFETTLFRLMAGAMIITIAAELAFTFYVSVYGLSNVIGHFFKIISFVFVYMALVHSSLTRPYATLFRDLEKERSALKESEASARRKIQAIIEPKGDICTLNLGDIIDREAIQSMLEEFYKLTNVLSAVLDLSGNILVAVGWQDICTKFHRCHPETGKNCLESDTLLSSGVPAGTFKAYRCKNNLWDMVTPIEIDGRHIGNIFIGQFFYDNETPDYDLFRRQARKYGFDETEYLAALDRVPRLSRETVDSAMTFFTKLAGMIASLSYSNVSLARTISQQENVYRKLKESDSKLRQAQYIAGMGNFTLDIATGAVNWSDGMYKLLQYNKSESIDYNKVNSDILHPDDLKRFSQWLIDGIASDDEFLTPKEYRLIRKDGQIIHVQTKGQIEYRDGKADKLFGTCLDISERKKNEIALQERDQYISTILETTQDGFWVLDAQGQVLDANEAYCRMTGYSRSEFQQLSISDLDVDEKPDETAARIKRIIKNGSELFTTRHRRKDGTVFDAELSVTWQADNFQRFICFCRDITGRKQVERERENTIKLLEILNARTSLRGLMHSILNYMRDLAGCEAVGIRLRDGEDFPYYEVSGFSDSFVKAEMHLCVQGVDGQLLRDEIGNPVLECMCGNVICGRFDPSKPFFTDYGSFISNGTTELLATTTEADRQARTRNRCNGEGYESVFLVPLRAGGERFGLLQFNDRSKGCFTPEFIIQAERLAAQVAIALAQLKAEEKLQEKEEEQRILLDNLRVGVVIHAPDTSVLVCNHDACGLLALTMDQMLGKMAMDHSWRFLFEDGSLMPVEAYPVNIVLAKRKKLENYILGIDTPARDSITWVMVSAYPVFTREAELRHIVVSFIDISGLKQVEKELRERDQDLMESQRIAHVGSWRLDISTNEVTWSDELYKMYGFDSSLPPPPYNEHHKIFTPESWDRLSKALPKTIETGIPYELELETVRQNESNGWMWVRGEVILDAKGATVGLRGAAQDITDRKQAEDEKVRMVAQLNQAQKMESVGRLAGGVAHDFNNMLGVILGHTEMILEQTDPDQPIYTDLEEIRNAADRSANLTRQLLAFARQQTIAPKVLDLNEVVEGMLNMLRRLIGEDIDLSWRPGNELGLVNMDPTQIDQLLVNLCVNARDAIADVGKITIETESATFDEYYCKEHAGFVSGEYVMLAVSDDGCGMDQETQANIFEPFFTTKDVGKGTGLGLATIFGIVKQSNGFIYVYSELNQGTTFKIYLPRHIAKSSQMQETIPKKQDLKGHETILLVEDEPAILKMTQRMLERLDYTIVTACTPGEALRKATEYSGQIHLLMTDVIMPEMNGRDLAKNILAIYPNINRLFMSGYTANVIAHHGVLDKGVNFIQKPFSKKVLAAKVREALDGESD